MCHPNEIRGSELQSLGCQLVVFFSNNWLFPQALFEVAKFVLSLSQKSLHTSMTVSVGPKSCCGAMIFTHEKIQCLWLYYTLF